MKVTSWRQYPVCLLGFDIRRWENQLNEVYLPEFTKKLLFFKSLSAWGPTHIQYSSPWGFLLQWPLCFHFWWQFREQQNGKPGTERVFYFRIGVARWDSNDDCYMVPTFYPPWSLHWD